MKNVRPSPPSPVAALPIKRVRELWCIIGRRGGKSRMAAALACYFALFVKHKLAGW
jgi:phage terminase large subunit-like protein